MITLPLLSTTAEQWEVTGKSVKSLGYYGVVSGSHTLSINVNNFSGVIHIEGSINDQNWFNISSYDYVKKTVTEVHIIKINCTYIRARMSRDGLPAKNDHILLYGNVGNILVKY